MQSEIDLLRTLLGVCRSARRYGPPGLAAKAAGYEQSFSEELRKAGVEVSEAPRRRLKKVKPEEVVS